MGTDIHRGDRCQEDFWEDMSGLGETNRYQYPLKYPRILVTRVLWGRNPQISQDIA
jgi:hypothetical protein